MNAIKFLRHVIPNQFKDSVVTITTCLTPVKRTTSYTNIYHCCVYKTGSQWIRRIFSDPRVYRWCGLKPINGAMLNNVSGKIVQLSERRKPEGFSSNRFVAGLFMSYDNFMEMKQYGNYVAFFIKRDPRELVVSWYFSTRYTHVKRAGVNSLRAQMKGMTDEEGIIFSIDYWSRNQLFDILLQWQKAEENNESIKVFSFEKLTGNDGFYYLGKIFSYCKIEIPQKKLLSVYEAHSAKNIASKKSDDKYAFASKNNNLKWPKYFTKDVEKYFLKAAPTLVEDLGYKW